MEEELRNEDYDYDNANELEEEEEQNLRIKGDWHQQLMKASQKGDFDLVKKCIEKKANINYKDRKHWTPIVWACCKGYLNIVRFLIQKNGTQVYKEGFENNNASSPNKSNFENSPEKDFGKTDETKKENFESPKKIPLGTIDNNIKPTPLQWACFKGWLEIVWLLLKDGMNYLDIDGLGNNCLHLAVSSGNPKIVESLLVFGVLVIMKNTRGHQACEMSTNKEITELFKKHFNTKECEICKKKFAPELALITKENKNLPRIKHWCRICKKFVCSGDFKSDWIYVDKESKEKEKLDGRCILCDKNIQEHTDSILQKMKEYNHASLEEKLKFIKENKIEVDIKILQDADILLEKLFTQNKLISFVDNLKYVPNYKTILKSVNILNEMLDDAKTRNVDIDAPVMEKIEKERDRLLAERNLRFQLDNLYVGNAKNEEVKNLEELNNLAKEKGVALEYIEEAGVLHSKMSKNIEANDIYQMFFDYPFREYPEPVIYDPKTKKPLDPVTKKPIDPKKLAPPPKKKKGKKEPKFIIPDWATEIKSLEEKIKAVEDLIKQRDTIEIPEEFLLKSKDHIDRKQLEEEAKILAEKKAAEAKKKK